jgi:2-isopropylmalate synthase
VTADIQVAGEARSIAGSGSGPIAAYVAALTEEPGMQFDVVDYHEQARGSGADATAVAYVEIRTAEGAHRFGVGMHRNILTASLMAVTAAANRAQVSQ